MRRPPEHVQDGDDQPGAAQQEALAPLEQHRGHQRGGEVPQEHLQIGVAAVQRMLGGGGHSLGAVPGVHCGPRERSGPLEGSGAGGTMRAVVEVGPRRGDQRDAGIPGGARGEQTVEQRLAAEHRCAHPRQGEPGSGQHGADGHREPPGDGHPEPGRHLRTAHQVPAEGDQGGERGRHAAAQQAQRGAARGHASHSALSRLLTRSAGAAGRRVGSHSGSKADGPAVDRARRPTGRQPPGQPVTRSVGLLRAGRGELGHQRRNHHHRPLGALQHGL